MNQNEKTITTKLTHDIIQKDFFALHVNYLKILRNLVLLLLSVIYMVVWIYALLPMKNKTLAVIFAFPTWTIFLITIGMLSQWLRDIFYIKTVRYQVVTDYVQQRRNRYEHRWNPLWYRKSYGLNYGLKSTLYSVRSLDELLFSKNRYFGLENHIYYKWSPMFELTDEQIFEHAQLGAKYHLVLCGKNIVMIYNAENFLLEN